MSAGDHPIIHLVEETILNVSSLLQEPVGSVRDLTLSLSRLRLDEDLVARDVAATARFTRLKAYVLVAATVEGVVPLECATCLKEYDQAFAESFTEQFRQTVDIRSGADLSEFARDENGEVIEDEPGFTIDDNHLLDLEEALRQWIVLAIPIKPSCGPDCPGPLLRSTSDDEDVDARFSGLASLLNEESDQGA